MDTAKDTQLGQSLLKLSYKILIGYVDHLRFYVQYYGLSISFMQRPEIESTHLIPSDLPASVELDHHWKDPVCIGSDQAPHVVVLKTTYQQSTARS
jgi:hypothetical protein